MPSAIILAVDIGGTFTDIVALDKGGERIVVEKLLTSYPDPSVAVMQGLRRLLEREQLPPESLAYVVHGTTLISNTLIERTGAKTALLATAGFRDAIEIGNEGRYDMYDLALQKPQPLVPRHLRFDVPERMLADGRVYKPLDEAALRATCQQLRELAIEAVGICFLHAYTNPAHELRALQITREALPGVALSASHQVAPGMREYPRASTTIANAYVQPIAARYLTRLQRDLQAADIAAPLNIMLSSGGTTTVAAARDFPIRLVESGPAGGALAGVYWGRLLGQRDVLAFDMGGTTAKAALTRQGELAISNQSEVAHVHRFKRGSGLPMMVPMIELIEIGAGGGSIARLNALGLPTVGPQSAGSSPGPAAYQLGGQQPTVTDADLLLGYLNPAYFAGGAIRLDADAARSAFTSLAAALDLPLERMAWGVHKMVNETMAAAARVHAAERGLELRRYCMVATGGAGPVHACGVAEGLGIKRIIIPPLAGVGSAFGFLTAPIAFDFTRSYVRRLRDIDLDELNAMHRWLPRWICRWSAWLGACIKWSMRRWRPRRAFMLPSAGWSCGAIAWWRPAARVQFMPVAWRRAWASSVSSSRRWLAWAAPLAFSPRPSPLISRAAMSGGSAILTWMNSTPCCAGWSGMADRLCGRLAYPPRIYTRNCISTCVISGRVMKCACPSLWRP